MTPAQANLRRDSIIRSSIRFAISRLPTIKGAGGTLKGVRKGELIHIILSAYFEGMKEWPEYLELAVGPEKTHELLEILETPGVADLGLEDLNQGKKAG